MYIHDRSWPACAIHHRVWIPIPDERQATAYATVKTPTQQKTRPHSPPPFFLPLSLNMGGGGILDTPKRTKGERTASHTTDPSIRFFFCVKATGVYTLPFLSKATTRQLIVMTSAPIASSQRPVSAASSSSSLPAMMAGIDEKHIVPSVGKHSQDCPCTTINRQYTRPSAGGHTTKAPPPGHVIVKPLCTEQLAELENSMETIKKQEIRRIMGYLKGILELPADRPKIQQHELMRPCHAALSRRGVSASTGGSSSHPEKMKAAAPRAGQLTPAPLSVASDSKAPEPGLPFTPEQVTAGQIPPPGVLAAFNALLVANTTDGKASITTCCDDIDQIAKDNNLSVDDLLRGIWGNWLHQIFSKCGWHVVVQYRKTTGTAWYTFYNASMYYGVATDDDNTTIYVRY